MKMLKNINHYALYIVFIILSNTAYSQEFGDWTVGFGQGYVEYTVKNGPGNTFTIVCDEGASLDHMGTGLMISIKDKSPPKNSTVKIVLDNKEVEISSDDNGDMKANCHVCSDNFVYLWEKIRKSKFMIVQFSNGNSSSFSLNGAKKALDKKVCRTGWMGK